jgi:predicted transcriptional regulator
VARRPDGALERDVLDVLWSADRPLQPGEINERLAADYAYTSIATILTRLQHKGLVERTAVGRAYAYRVTVDESDLAARKISELLDSSSDRALVLSRFITGLSAKEAKAIRAMLDKAAQQDKGR